MGRKMSIYTKMKMANNTNNTHSTSPLTKQPQTIYPHPLVIIMPYSINQIQHLQKQNTDNHALFDQPNPNLLVEMGCQIRN